MTNSVASATVVPGGSDTGVGAPWQAALPRRQPHSAPELHIPGGSGLTPRAFGSFQQRWFNSEV